MELRVPHVKDQWQTFIPRDVEAEPLRLIPFISLRDFRSGVSLNWNDHLGRRAARVRLLASGW